MLNTHYCNKFCIIAPTLLLSSVAFSMSFECIAGFFLYKSFLTVHRVKVSLAFVHCKLNEDHILENVWDDIDALGDLMMSPICWWPIGALKAKVQC